MAVVVEVVLVLAAVTDVLVAPAPMPNENPPVAGAVKVVGLNAEPPNLRSVVKRRTSIKNNTAS